MVEATRPPRWDAQQHVQLLVTLHWVATGLFGLAFLALSYTVGAHIPGVPFAMIPLMGLHAASAMGLMQRSTWGRTVSMVTAGISLLGGLPGIAFAIYAFIIHSRPDVKDYLTEDAA